jgi:hypothetical protein
MWIKLKRIEQSGTVVRTEKAQQFKVPLQSVVLRPLPFFFIYFPAD